MIFLILFLGLCSSAKYIICADYTTDDCTVPKLATLLGIDEDAKDFITAVYNPSSTAIAADAAELYIVVKSNFEMEIELAAVTNISNLALTVASSDNSNAPKLTILNGPALKSLKVIGCTVEFIRTISFDSVTFVGEGCLKKTTTESDKKVTFTGESECAIADVSKYHDVKIVGNLLISFDIDLTTETEPKILFTSAGLNIVSHIISIGAQSIPSEHFKLNPAIKFAATGSKNLLLSTESNSALTALIIQLLNVESGKTLPVLFDDSWSALEAQKTIDIIVSKATDCKVNGTPAKVTMTLKNFKGMIYDMQPFNSARTMICIGLTEMCGSFPSEEGTYFRSLIDIASANDFIKTINQNQTQFGIIVFDTMTSNEALDFSTFKYSFYYMIINGPEDDIPIDVNIKMATNKVFAEYFINDGISLNVNADAGGIFEIQNYDAGETSGPIKGSYIIHNIETILTTLSIFKGVVSDRFYITIDIYSQEKEQYFLNISEDGWFAGDGSDLTKGTNIKPSNETFESAAFFIKLNVQENANYTIYPNSIDIKKALPLSIYALKETELSQHSKLLETTSKVSITFDKTWEEVNMDEKFVLRFIGNESLLVDQTNVNTNAISVKLEDTLPDQSQDKDSLKPDPILPSETPKPKSNGLSAGAIAGIAVACVAVVAAIAFGIFYVIRKD